MGIGKKYLADMKEQKEIFQCQHCGAQFQKWNGRCLECGKWGTLEKTEIKAETRKDGASAGVPIRAVSLGSAEATKARRLGTSIPELDRVFGGGIMPASLTLLGGEPGIGKSTLSLQLAAAVPNTLYVSGEESLEQIKMRFDRLQLASSSLLFGSDTDADNIARTIRDQKPPLAIVDSIQTISAGGATGEAGSVSQVRACASILLSAAKESGTAIVLIGHVTKDGDVAGPKTLEHLVDTVLYLEGDRFHSLRILRASKNRFGSTDETGVFDMKETGLSPVANPSAAFLAERGENMPGSVVTCIMEGTRPVLVEVQALVNKTSFGYPVRKASGFDLNRLHVLLAVLEKRAGLRLSQYDVHLNIVGGIRAGEPAADLAVCLAVASAYKDKMLGNDMACFGEVGLGGEIRSVSGAEKRAAECAHLGLKRVILPAGNKSAVKAGLTGIGVKNIDELIRQT